MASETIESGPMLFEFTKKWLLMRWPTIYSHLLAIKWNSSGNAVKRYDQLAPNRIPSHNFRRKHLSWSQVYYLHCGNCIYIEVKWRKDFIVWSHAIVISSVLLKFNCILLLHKCNMLDFIIILVRQKFCWILHTNLYTHTADTFE